MNIRLKTTSTAMRMNLTTVPSSVGNCERTHRPKAQRSAITIN